MKQGLESRFIALSDISQHGPYESYRPGEGNGVSKLEFEGDLVPLHGKLTKKTISEWG